ncbi:MAG: tyrosine-type recombinase/integrase [Actinomycetaceae bacterium]|nr:tyrosine-type recombinase/integrase [Arcanobacterium sp.]MDD7504748.1 tyrosine-type recombinase/integrase [Actinomycetaceae bacterium]MDY6143581.1 tyrosine-type recombinase/integrase [Arcanobacterium sp.]
MPLAQACEADCLAFLATPGWSSETARSVRSTLRSFYTWAADTGRLTTNPAVRLPVIHEKPPLPHPLPEAEYQRALDEAPNPWRIGIRLAGEAGLRRSEVAQVARADLFRDLFGVSLRVHGKGGKERAVPLNESLGVELRTWLRGHVWLFPSGTTSTHLTPDYVAKRIRQYLPPEWSMHSLRHRFATVAYARTSDIRAVQELLGHANLNTTQRYVAMPVQRLRAVASTARAA